MKSHLLQDLVQWMDAELRVRDIPDYSAAVNGLQLENRGGTVTRIAAAVDASLPVIKKAVAEGADLLLVHHGLFWSPMQPLTGSRFEKVAAAIGAGLAVYSAHLPLDVHPALGNNAGIVQAMGWTITGTFLDYKGTDIGLVVETDQPLEEVVRLYGHALDGGAVHVCPGGPGLCRRIGICSGGSGSEVAAAAKAGIDTFLTGEAPHWSYSLAEELGINVLYGGHYATETFGVKALAAALEARFGVPWSFVDHPTGL